MVKQYMEKVKIKTNALTKVYGPNRNDALKMLKEGSSKDEILKKTGATIGVDNAEFEVNEGELFVIMGLSGSGKSTLIRMVNRLIEPTSGEIFIDGEDIVKMDRKEMLELRRHKIGMVFQHFALMPHRNILNNIAYGLEIQGIDKAEREEKAMVALQNVGLDGYENSMPSELSGGMQQRVGLARALANESEILLMDEAFSALDPLIRKEMQNELLVLQDEMQKTILFITHDLDEALKLGDRIAIMNDGKIVQIGTPDEILNNPVDDYVSSFIEDVDRSKVLNAENIMKKPDVVTNWRDGALVAIRRMEGAGISSIFVVERGRRLKGLLTIDAALEAVRNKTWNEEILNQDFFTTTKDTPLRDLIPIAAETKYPIAVVEEDRLVGIIVRVSILSGLYLKDEEEDVE